MSICMNCGSRHNGDGDCLDAVLRRVAQAERERDEARHERDEAREGRAEWEAVAIKYLPYKRERDEARAEVARLRHDPKADARAVIEEWRAKAERAWSDATWAQEQRVAMLQLLKQCRTHLPTPRRPDTPYGQLVAAVHAAIAGQPAPAKVAVDDAMVERACRVLDPDWDRKIDDADDNHHGELSDGMIATRKKARAALVAALEGRA